MSINISSLNIDDLPNEIWKQYEGYSKYLISNYSRVKSLIGNPKILTRTLSNGRVKVVMSTDKYVITNEDCARLCAKVFLREPKDNEIISFKDDNRLNTKLENIAWIKIPDAKFKGNRKLTKEDVISIRERSNYGFTYKELSNEYNVKSTCIRDVVNQTTWKNI